MSIYRIKPLEWKNGFASDSWESPNDVYVIIRMRSGRYHAFYEGRIFGDFPCLSEAKEGCEKHRKKSLDVDFEPVYQPSTELPTDPGWYWFIGDSSTVWSLEDGKVFRGIYGTRVDRDKWDMKGQWLRITEPEASL